MALTPEEKLELIAASFREEVSVADLCRQAQVPESTFRDWRERFLAAGMAAWQLAKPTKGDAEKHALIQENARLQTVFADPWLDRLGLPCRCHIVRIGWFSDERL